MLEKTYKVYVDITALHKKDGGMRPLSVVWLDGKTYDIDAVTDVRRAASLKAGGVGLRYTCRIAGQTTFLFYEEDRWFVESKEPREGVSS